VLQLQFRYEGTISLIDTAIETRENVVAIHAAKGYQVQAFRNILNLSTCYGTRYEATGRRGDLDRSIELSREATKLSNETVELQRLAFGNLALSLTCRFDMAGDKDDLEEALALAKKAAATFPPDHFQHTMILSTLASVLFRRYLLYKDLNDLNSAVDMFSRCVTGTATRHYHQSDRQLSLAQAYMLRYQDATGLTDDIDRAIDLSREAVSLRPAEHSRRYEALNTLASALFSRYTSLENIPDYDCALSAQREALALLPEGHTYQARALFGLARIYLLEGTPTHSVANAISLCTKAIRSNNAVAHLSLKEVLEVLPALERAAALTSFPKEDRINLLELYREIISLFPRVAYFGLDLRTRLRVLAEAEHIATSAAFHAISLDLPEVAIELLEHGRAVFWSQSLRLREEFDALPSEMAEKLTSIAHRLESGSGSQPNPEAGKSVLEEQAKQMRMLSDEFQDLVVKARSIPGFERFLLDDTYETLCSVAEKGPVVVFVSANRRSCALILQKGLPLQRVDLDADPHMISRKFTLMLGNTRFMSKETRNGAANGHHAPLRLALKLLNKENGNAAVVEEMWIKVMKPVVTALGLRVSGMPYDECNTKLTSYVARKWEGSSASLALSHRRVRPTASSCSRCLW
jgi:tetratricopeptide (TPR) repeat protein